MPTMNIPPRIRFALYIAGALALPFITYAVDKGWAGKPEVQLVTTLAALLGALAAAKTDLSENNDSTNEYQGHHQAPNGEERR